MFIFQTNSNETRTAMTSLLNKTLCAAALSLAFANLAGAQTKLGDAVPVGPQVKVGHLANGLTY